MENRQYFALKRIHLISTLQSVSLDEAVLAAIYTDHLANQPTDATAGRRAVIEGRQTKNVLLGH